MDYFSDVLNETWGHVTDSDRNEIRWNSVAVIPCNAMVKEKETPYKT
jgi:hypothetical protein